MYIDLPYYILYTVHGQYKSISRLFPTPLNIYPVASTSTLYYYSL